MKKILPFLLLAFVSCTPQKRIARICKKHPDVCQSKADTFVSVKYYETKDTVYQLTKEVDTIYHITQKGDSIRIINNVVTKTITVKEVLKPDSITTIIRHRIVTQREIKSSTWTTVKSFLVVEFFFLLFIAVFYFLAKVFKKSKLL